MKILKPNTQSSIPWMKQNIILIKAMGGQERNFEISCKTPI